jgi:hypothetical protein
MNGNPKQKESPKNISPRYLNKLIKVLTILKAAGGEGLKIKKIKNKMCNKNLEKYE